MVSFGALWILFFYSSAACFTRQKMVLLAFQDLLLHAQHAEREREREREREAKHFSAIKCFK